MAVPPDLRFAFPSGRLAERIRERKRPVQSRAKSTVEALLEATLQVLVRDGYAALTTVRVAERAGVSVGTLYQYFPDKRSLVTALKVQYVSLLMERVAGAARAAIGRPLEDAVRAMIGGLLHAKRESLVLALALREPMAELGGDAMRREATVELVGVTREVLEAAVPGLRDGDAVGRIVVAAVEGAVSAAVYESPERLEEPAFEDELVALVVGYVRARTPAAR